ncbi:insulinase family protein [Algibacillus agarilyticus]|uniref:insulinase family protein n=1 Tax=Algibacillus agarilyticus TaxID=2234133 RepID=UPI000DD0D2AA|nr:insulinase family protein [Algibacillus agarilyticus]
MIKSPNDHREYQSLTLKNGLRILLIHDVQSSKGAASLVVNAGHFDDPKDCAGLAHFMEHMLFLGTESYPEADEYQKLINQHSGHNNAWTSSQHTNFYLDIDANAFETALAYFSQLFICPLFSQHYIDKERHAIESEFELKRKDELRRLYEVHKETCNPRHPFSQFSVGNLSTLVDKPNLSLKQRLQHFFKTHYTAGNMTLVLAGPHSLPQLHTLATHYFAAIKPTTQSKTPLTEPLYLASHLGQHIQVQTRRETNQIMLSFAFGAMDDRYHDKSIAYLSYMLGREDEGSLFNCLREKGYINGLSAGGGIDGSNFKDFNISLQLTESGKSNLDTLVKAAFAYIQYLKHQPICEFIYSEKQRLAKLAFEYQEQAKLLDIVSHLALKMHTIPTQDLLISDYLMTGLDKDWLTAHFDLLTPQNMRLVQLSHESLEPNCTVSPWYNTPYTITPFSKQQYIKWQPISLGALKQYQFTLPQANPYVADRVTPFIAEAQSSAHPEHFIHEHGLKFWYKQDTLYTMPKGHIYVSFDLENSQGSLSKNAYTRLFIELFLDKIETQFYAAATAGVSYHIYPHQTGLTLHISGFSDKQLILLNNILDSLNHFTLCQARFDEVKHQLQQSWRNSNKGKPISMLFNQLNNLLQNNQYSVIDMADSLESVSLTEFQHFSETLFSKVCIEALAYGDFSLQCADNIAATLKTFIAQAQATDEIARQVYILNQHEQQHLVAPVKSEHCLITYYQATDDSLESTALFTLANQIISQAFFHSLRTEQQIGYMLGTSYMPINQLPGLITYVQSSTTEPQDILQAIDAFFVELPEQLTEMGAELFDHIKQGLAQQLLDKDTSMRVTAQRFWLAIGLKDETFIKKQQIAKSILNIEFSTLYDFMVNQLVNHSQQTRLVISSAPLNQDNANVSTIESIAAFQQSAQAFEF